VRYRKPLPNLRMQTHDGFCRQYGKNPSGGSHRPDRSLRAPFAQGEGWIAMHTHIFALLDVLVTLLG
jgi:hypothetical protein